jgi:hypothetical protein
VQRTRLTLFVGAVIWMITSTLSAQTVKASYDLFGMGCKGTVGVPRLFAEPPKIGSEFVLAVTNLPKLEIGAIGFGIAEMKPPFDMSVIGMPGCFLYIHPILCVPISTGLGRAVLLLNIPNDPQLLGKIFFNQAVINDRPVNRFGMIMSNAGKGTVGSRNQK